MRIRITVLALTGLLASSLAPTAELSNEPILYIGDSISYGKFGLTIDNALKGISDNVTIVASCGARPSTYLTPAGSTPEYAKTICGFWRNDPKNGDIRTKTHQTPPLPDLLHPSPRVTIVQLGTNIAAGKDPTSAANVEAVDQMLQEIKTSGSKCIWIGPPDANSPVVTREKLAATVQMLQTETKRYGCAFIDTLSFTKFPDVPGDGIHPSPDLAIDWADSVDRDQGKLLSTVTRDLSE